LGFVSRVAGHGGFESVADDQMKPMSFDERSRLCEEFQKLPSDKIVKGVHIIQSREPCLVDSNTDEVEIDFETLQPATLRKVEAYVASCLTKKPRKPYGKGELYYSILLPVCN